MVPLAFVSEGVVLRYFSMVTSIATPRHVAAQEMRLECMFPADEATGAGHQELLVLTARARTR